MTPAEQLAETKQKQRAARNYPAKRIEQIWVVKLRVLRDAHNLSQREVAHACGLSVSSYNRIEHGVADPQLSSAFSIAEFFDCHPSEIWTELTVVGKRGIRTSKNRTHKGETCERS